MKKTQAHLAGRVQQLTEAKGELKALAELFTLSAITVRNEFAD